MPLVVLVHHLSQNESRPGVDRENGRHPAISQRVVNETVAVVEYLNDLPP
jgi:hypothetical protein